MNTESHTQRLEHLASALGSALTAVRAAQAQRGPDAAPELSAALKRLSDLITPDARVTEFIESRAQYWAKLEAETECQLLNATGTPEEHLSRIQAFRDIQAVSAEWRSLTLQRGRPANPIDYIEHWR